MTHVPGKQAGSGGVRPRAWGGRIIGAGAFVSMLILAPMLARTHVALSAAPLPSQTATRVYGQAGSFTTNTHSLPASDTLFRPFAVSVDRTGGLYVADSTNNRVLHFPAGSTTADAVYGQNGSFSTGTCNNGGISAASLCFPVGMAVDREGGLYVADSYNNRVLHYRPPTHGTDYAQTTATRVYGQNGSFTTNSPAIAADTLDDPVGVVLAHKDGIYVGEYANNRVLHFPAGSATADAVYGQNGSFTTNIPGATASTIAPGFLTLDRTGGIYAVDAGNNRVLHFPSGSTTADAVYGQNGSFTSSASGTSATSFNFPVGITVDRTGGLYVADTSNNRVLYFPSEGTASDAVSGQG